MTDWQSQIVPLVEKALPKSQFEILDILPVGGKLHRLAGPEGILAPLASQFLAIHDVVAGGIELESWIDKFEACFPDVQVFANPDFMDKLKPWGRNYEDRPRIYIREHDEKTGLYLCEIFPEGKDFPSEMIFGNTKEIIGQAMFLMALNRQLARYDIGGLLGMPVNDYLRNYPSDSVSAVFRLKTKPKSYDEPMLYKTVRVPFVAISKLDYSRIWNACGGNDGLEYGPIGCRAKIGKGEDINKLYEVVSFGPNESSAKANVQRFLDFSSLDVKKFTYNKSEWENISDTSLNDTYKIYPCSFSILNTKLSTADRKGQLTSGGYKKSAKARILLRGETAPPEFDEIKQNLLQLINSP
jgi:hypothetical protein